MRDLVLLAPAAHAAGDHAAAPLWLTPGFWVGLSMLVLIAVMLRLRVPAMVAAALDRKIAAIRAMLDEAATLRREAEALRAEYEDRLKSADAHAAQVRAAAEEEAKAILSKAKEDAAALIARRGKMAQDKIAAAERAAIEELRARAAAAAAAAAADLIARKHDAEADGRLIDQTIASI